MLTILTRLDANFYGIPTRDVLEITPLVPLRETPQAHAPLVGVCTYRGRIAPVLDLSLLLAGRRSRPRYSTRILFLERHGGAGDVLGLIAEGVTETLTLDDALLAAGLSLRAPDQAWLGAMVQHEIGLIQMLEPVGLALPALPDGGSAV